jgi:hypothetical protein
VDLGILAGDKENIVSQFFEIRKNDDGMMSQNLTAMDLTFPEVDWNLVNGDALSAGRRGFRLIRLNVGKLALYSYNCDIVSKANQFP